MSSQAQIERRADATSAPPPRVVGSGLAALLLGVHRLAAAIALAAAPAAAQEAGDAGAEAADAVVEGVVEGVLDASMLRVRSVLLDLEGFGRWYPALGEWRVLERDRVRALVYGRQSLPWPVRDRDYVVEYRWRDEPEGFVLEATSVPGSGPPPPEGVVRVPWLVSQWRIRPQGERTRASYRYRGSLGGLLPAWVTRLGWEAQASRVLDGLAAELQRVRPLHGL